MALVTLEQFASFMQQDAESWDIARARILLEGAEAEVVEYCGWHIAPSITEDLVVDGTGTQVLTLPTLNMTALNSISELGTTLDPDKIAWSANGLLEKLGYTSPYDPVSLQWPPPGYGHGYGYGRLWTPRRRGVTVNITHGFPAAPAWVVSLICAVAGRVFLGPPGVVSEAAGGESVTYAARGVTELPGAVHLAQIEKRMLDRLRVPLAA